LSSSDDRPPYLEVIMQGTIRKRGDSRQALLNVILRRIHGKSLVPTCLTYDGRRSSRSEAKIDTTSTRAIKLSEIVMGMCHQYEIVILIPTKARMTPNPVCR